MIGAAEVAAPLSVSSESGSELNDLVWRRSRRCDTNACVEIARLEPGSGVAMRNSQTPREAILHFPPAAWTDFVEAVRRGEFDRGV